MCKSVSNVAMAPLGASISQGQPLMADRALPHAVAGANGTRCHRNARSAAAVADSDNGGASLQPSRRHEHQRPTSMAVCRPGAGCFHVAMSNLCACRRDHFGVTVPPTLIVNWIALLGSAESGSVAVNRVSSCSLWTGTTAPSAIVVSLVPAPEIAEIVALSIF